MNKNIVAREFTRIVAMHLDFKDQLMEGVALEKIDKDRWIDRYKGRIPTDGTMKFNQFNPEVSHMVASLMVAIDESELI